MPTHNIVYLPSAIGDLQAIFDYIAADRPKAAYGMMDRMEHAIAGLADYPYLGRVPANKVIKRMCFRMLIVDAYIVFYKAKDECVEIHRVLHGKQKYAHIIESE